MRLKTHKTQILAEHKEDLLVPELVFGDTVEELDKSLESALARSEEIRKQMGVTTKKDKRTLRILQILRLLHSRTMNTLLST